MKVAILKERELHETRVGATPETVKKLIELGASVFIEKNAGESSKFPDAEYKEAGAKICANAASALKGADIVLCVRRPKANSLVGVVKGALVIGMMDPFGNEGDIAALAKRGVNLFAMELMPRITRAQVMDVLSSQANLAGYQSVIEAAAVFDKAFPMMMTAAGTIRPAKVFIMGAGVAGLQAIATARRLGAVVSANDVRPAAKEQVQSLGGKFIAVENEEFKQAETAAGYAKAMSKDYQKLQAELVAKHITKQDIVITTALIPGRDAPILVTKKMLESMGAGSIIVDLATERGGNCELSKKDEIIEHKGVSIIGYANMAGRVANSASSLYARNLFAFLETMFDKEKKALNVDYEDELVMATNLTRNGKIVHEALKKTPVKKPTVKKAATKQSSTKKIVAKKPVVKKTKLKSHKELTAKKSQKIKGAK
ncbi:MAG: Re/Si-specific NAD(P)(+) transhydrogenase subunit alpha [Devosiaceae bacterium]|nr:Re/Si-specific NAD(P)(+) transhydrogenase subunit alpha [Devosiaceae bacterium]